MKTYAVWLLMSWNSVSGLTIHQPYFPSFQECENVRKNIEEIVPYSNKTRCVRSDILQTVDMHQTK